MEKMPISIEGFSQVEYLTVFNTIIFGYVGAEYFNGWGSMIRYRDFVKIDPLHLSWTIFVFFIYIQNWFGVWPRTHYVNDNIFYFYYSLVPLLLFYLLSVVLFPNLKKGDTIDFKEYFKYNNRWFFILFSMYLSTSIINSFIYEDHGDVVSQNIIRLLGVMLSLVTAFYNKNRFFQFLMLIVGVFSLISFMLKIPK